MSTDQEMQLRWIERRDADAFAELVMLYAGMVYATCRRVLSDATDAEDVAQECFIELARTARVVKPSIGGWLHRVAVYRSLNHLRAESRRNARELRYSAEQPTALVAEWDHVKPHLDAAIAELPEKLRLAVVHRFLEGKSQDEVAKDLGISRTAAQYRIHRGVDMIREELRHRGVIITAAALVELASSRTAEAAPASLIARLGEGAIAAYPVSGPAPFRGIGKAREAIFSWYGTSGIVASVVAAGAMVWVLAGNGTSPTEAQAPRIEITGAPETVQALPLPAAVPEAGGTQGFAVAATEGAVVWGRVYAKSNDEPFPFFHVEAYAAGNDSEPIAKTTADETGMYRLEGLPPGEYTIHSYDNRLSYNEQVKGELGSGAPCRAGQASLRVNGEDETIRADIGLDVDLCLLGQAVLQDGSPVAGALVWARGENEVHQYWAERASNGAGGFMFIGLEPKTEVYLQASAEGYVSQVTGPFTVGDRDVTNAKAVLEPAASVEGTVCHANGEPAPHAKIWLRPGAERSVHPRFVTCDEAGGFEARGLAAGDYEFLLAPITSQPTDEDTDTSHYFWGSIDRVYSVPEPVLRLTLHPGEHRPGLRPTFSATGIAGRVADVSRNPIAGARITLMGGADDTTGDDGRYELVGVPAGAHSVYVSHEDFRPDRLDDVASGTRDADFVLEQRGVVEGNVVDARTGAPIEEFSLHTGADGDYAPWMDRWFEEHNDPEGRFTHKPIFPTERIFARAKGYSVNSAVAENVAAGGPPARVTIALERIAPVTGVVVGPDGRPVARAAVFNGELPRSERDRERALLATTDAEGRFTLETLPAGPSRIVAHHEVLGYGEAMTAGENDTAETLTVTLEALGEVSGRVTADGQPVAEQPVTMLTFRSDPREVSEPTAPRSSNRRETDAAGAFVFREVPAGYAQLSCQIGNRTRFLHAEIVSGETTTVDIELPPLTATLRGTVHGMQTLSPAPIAISLYVETDAGGESMQAAIGLDGTYSFDGVAAGTATLYVVVPEAPGLLVPGTLEIHDGAALVNDIDVAACVSISGEA